MSQHGGQRGNYFERKFTDEQRAAIINAQVDHGLSAPKAREAALAGELPGWAARLPPMDPAPSEWTCADWASAERKKRRASMAHAGEPEMRLVQAAHDLAEMYAKDVDEVKKNWRRGRKPTPEKLAALARTGKEIAAYNKATVPSTGAGPGRGGKRTGKKVEPAANGKGTADEAFLEQLANEKSSGG